MVTVRQSFASGNWTVAAGREDEFVARWTEFLQWTQASAPGFGRAALIRDVSDPRHFISFAEWENEESRRMWRTLPEFAARYAACKSLCDDFRGGDFTLAVSITE